jgi:hypothetical protein
MITKEQVIPMILEACPSFQESWEKSDDKELPYVIMGDLARHLLKQYRNQQTCEFNPLCEVIERLHADGDDEVREFATVGILEGVQTVWGHSEIDPDKFTAFLLPESQKAWSELNDCWTGK